MRKDDIEEIRSKGGRTKMNSKRISKYERRCVERQMTEQINWLENAGTSVAEDLAETFKRQVGMSIDEN